MSFDVFNSRLRSGPERNAELNEWEAEVFRLGSDESVLVAEVRCAEPGCPPLETVIALLGTAGWPRQFKIPKALADVTFADVLEVAKSAWGSGHSCDKE
jgi:hypothetical protein